MTSVTTMNDEMIIEEIKDDQDSIIEKSYDR
jgi:hypothetical protein